MFIYCIHCSTTGKKYVGLTRQTVEKRYKQHLSARYGKRERHRRLYQAFLKHGVENFYYGVIEECEDSIGPEREQYWVKELNSYTNGYNCDWGGSSTVVSEETKKKMSNTWKKKGTSNRKGKKNSEESNTSRSQTLKERYSNTEHHRKGKDPWNKGKKDTQPKVECPHCSQLFRACNLTMHIRKRH